MSTGVLLLKRNTDLQSVRPAEFYSAESYKPGKTRRQNSQRKNCAPCPRERPAQGPNRAGSARTNDSAADMAGGAISDGWRRERLASNGQMTTQEYSPDPFLPLS